MCNRSYSPEEKARLGSNIPAYTGRVRSHLNRIFLFIPRRTCRAECDWLLTQHKVKWLGSSLSSFYTKRCDSLVNLDFA
jgi:hypothetical protein